jgi:hypothetical protein
MFIVDMKTRRALAEAAPCDPRTISKLLRGEPVRGKAADRARAVLAAAGVGDPGNGPARDGGAPAPRRGGGGGGGRRSLPVVEIVGLLPAELGGSTRLFLGLDLLDRLSEAQRQWAGDLEAVGVVLALEALAELRGTSRTLDPQHQAAELHGVPFVAGRDGRGALLLQLGKDLKSTIAGAVLDVRGEIEVDRAALRANLISAAAAGSGAKA